MKKCRNGMAFTVALALAGINQTSHAQEEVLPKSREARIAWEQDRGNEAIRLWTIDAEKGDVPSQWMLGKLYAHGYIRMPIIVSWNYVKARHWLSRCAPTYKPCALHLAELYANGRGVKEDAKLAASIYREILTSPEEWPEVENEARDQLGSLYNGSHFGKENRWKAEALYRAAAEEGHDSAQYSLGVYCLHKADATPSDLIEGAKWLNLSSNSMQVGISGASKTFLKRAEAKMTRAEYTEGEVQAMLFKPVAHRRQNPEEM